MSENNEFFIATFIRQYEAIIMDHVKKQAEAETRALLLEAAVTERTKQVEQLRQTNGNLEKTLEEALNGLKLTTKERDQLSSDYKKLNDVIKERDELLKNNSFLCDQLERIKLDNETLKNNYKAITNALSTCNEEKQKLLNKQDIIVENDAVAKKRKPKQSEWIDGN